MFRVDLRGIWRGRLWVNMLGELDHRMGQQCSLGCRSVQWEEKEEEDVVGLKSG
jgi:hypothetical protein